MEQLNELLGKRVYVYRNLHKNCFSVMLGGKVVAHVPEIHLKDVEFRVRENGRQKVLKTKQKSVHAFVIGTVTTDFKFPLGGITEVQYDPYKYDSFTITGNDRLKYAAAARLTNNKVYI